jgi:hypothetical protein
LLEERHVDRHLEAERVDLGNDLRLALAALLLGAPGLLQLLELLVGDITQVAEDQAEPEELLELDLLDDVPGRQVDLAGLEQCAGLGRVLRRGDRIRDVRVIRIGRGRLG